MSDTGNTLITVKCRNTHTFTTTAAPGNSIDCPECRRTTGKRVAVYVRKPPAADAVERLDHAPAEELNSAGMISLRAEVDQLRAEVRTLRRQLDDHGHGPEGDSDDYRRGIVGRWLHELQHALAASGVILAGGGLAITDAATALGITDEAAGSRLREAAKLGLVGRGKSGRRNVYVFHQDQRHLYHATDSDETEGY